MMGKIIIRKVGVNEFVEEALKIFLDPRAELTKEQTLRLIATLEKEHGIEIQWEVRQMLPGPPDYYYPREWIEIISYRFNAEEIAEDSFYKQYGTLANAEKELKMKGYIIEKIKLR